MFFEYMFDKMLDIEHMFDYYIPIGLKVKYLQVTMPVKIKTHCCLSQKGKRNC